MKHLQCILIAGISLAKLSYAQGERYSDIIAKREIFFVAEALDQGDPIFSLLGWGAAEGAKLVKTLVSPRAWIRQSSRWFGGHKSWHTESVTKYKEYLTMFDKTFGKHFVEAETKISHKGFRHEFDCPGKWFQNLMIPQYTHVQVLCKTPDDVGIQKYTCAWWQPNHGLLIGNIRSTNLAFDIDIRGEDENRLRTSKLNGVLDYGSIPEASQPILPSHNLEQMIREGDTDLSAEILSALGCDKVSEPTIPNEQDPDHGERRTLQEIGQLDERGSFKMIPIIGGFALVVFLLSRLLKRSMTVPLKLKSGPCWQYPLGMP